MAAVAASRAMQKSESSVTLVGLLTETDFEAPELKPSYTRRERIIEGEVVAEDEEAALIVELKA